MSHYIYQKGSKEDETAFSSLFNRLENSEDSILKVSFIQFYKRKNLGESPISVKNTRRYVNQQAAVMSLSMCPEP